ncbi:hypothetical protein S83_058528 [Arachis hypogaea]
MHEECIPTQAPHYSLTQILGTSTHDEEQYRHIIDWVQGPESSQWYPGPCTGAGASRGSWSVIFGCEPSTAVLF